MILKILRYYNYSLIFLISFLLSFCASEPKKTVHKVSSYWNYLAEFISGMEMSSENPFLSLANKKAYQTYVKNINNYWDKIQKDYLDKVSNWKKEYLTNFSPNNTVLYLLAGGDFINMYNLNSESPRYVMIGLQKPGFFRDPFLLSEAELRKAFANIENVVHELAYYNYSTSKRLQQESNNPYFNGITPTLLFFIKRFGYEVLELNRVYLDENGIVHVDESPVEVFDKKKYTGVKIIFANQEQTEMKELYFFRIWLNGNSISPATPEGKFFLSLGKLNLMFKSAEYILHTKEYESFIIELLKRTDRVVQDESGIPFRYFDPKDWSYKLYGKYIGRIPLKNTPQVPFQNDLYEAFKKESYPLSFPFGYGVLKGKDKSNLLLFERKSLQIQAIFLK